MNRVTQTTCPKGNNTQRANLQTYKYKHEAPSDHTTPQYQAIPDPSSTDNIRGILNTQCQTDSLNDRNTPLTNIEHAHMMERAMKATRNNTRIGKENTPPDPNKHKGRATSRRRRNARGNSSSPLAHKAHLTCYSLSAPWGFVVGYLLIYYLGEVFTVSIPTCHAGDPGSIPGNIV